MINTPHKQYCQCELSVSVPSPLGWGLNLPQNIFKTFISNWTFLVYFEVLLKTVYELLFVHKITYS